MNHYIPTAVSTETIVEKFGGIEVDYGYIDGWGDIVSREYAI